MVSPDPIQFMALPCRDVTSWNLTDRCHFVRSVPSCEPNAGFIDYLEVIYCLLGPEKHLYTLGMSAVRVLVAAEVITSVESADTGCSKNGSGVPFRYVDADERRELEIPINNDNNNSEIEPDRSVYFINLGADFLEEEVDVGLEMAGGVVPIVAIVAAVGAILGSAVLLTSKNDEAPKYHSAFAYAGFFVGVVWIYVISMEIVVLLQAVGLVFNISDTILGLTILAWGNGLLDFLANLNIARKGYPRMSISACFGTPCLTLLLGVGIPSLVQLAGTGNVLVLQYSKLITVLFSGLAASLVSSLVTMTALKFHSRRFYGGYLLALYFTFLVIAVLVESEFI
ncbi:Na+/Ca2+ K+ independent exchanger, putative [Ixodes scapularis]|uniref:Na+/Ca2+ K+ independent exchanger, putative n=1 Tax=Ixodes scapularis TaxID=6945 RepID=B7QE16_IXOSC|nr:Na+/Ca2+ K+ independent exchanger, putative [Ixodes scapularis]|eukprot:XP_002413780.1 Na+/Ca2+ K+ independent exchanger, putative [Ixodes scapularis]